METSTLLFAAIALLTLLLIGTIFLLISYSGLFESVQVGAGKSLVANLKVVYKYGKGPTKNMGAVFTEVTSIAPKLKCFGVYYDDPIQERHGRDHKWAVGCVMAEGSATPDAAILQKFQEEGYKVFKFPEVSHVVHAKFPCRTSLSILLGIYKVYPLLADYIKSHRLCAHPWLEIYDGENIYYMGPLAKQNEFYVPETSPDYEDEQLVSRMQGDQEEHGQGDVPVAMVTTDKGKTSDKLRAKNSRLTDGSVKPGAKGQGQKLPGEVEGFKPEVKVTPETANHVPGPSGDCGVPPVLEKVADAVQRTVSEQPPTATTATTPVETPVEISQLKEPLKEPTCCAGPKVSKSDSKSMTPSGRVNIVTDVQGRRASSSVSGGRSGSTGQIGRHASKPGPKCTQRSVSEAADMRTSRGKALGGVQESGVTSTTDHGLFSDSDTLTDPDSSFDRSWSSVSGASSFASDYPNTESPYSESSYLSESSYISESSFASGSDAGTISDSQGQGQGSLLLELSSDSEGETVGVGETVLKPVVASQ